SSLALFDRIFEYLDLPVDISEREGPVEWDPTSVRGAISFRSVGFSYDAGGEPTLQDIDIDVPAGTHTAIVGETGSGKTTLGYLVARLYDPVAGTVPIDGVDVLDLAFASHAETVGLVSKETSLFHVPTREH